MQKADPGQAMRMEILRQDAESKILEELRTHNWTASISREFADGLIITAERGGHTHAVALIYSSATDNRVYKSLAAEVEHIFFNGQPYLVEQFTHGVTKTVGSVDDFHDVLLDWNKASADGKFAPESNEKPASAADEPTILRPRLLLADEPIEAIWLRLRQLQSVTLARKMIEARARAEQTELDADSLQSKAQGVAYALRNASDYFQAKDGQSFSQRVLNLYYGSVAFAFAEMLATPRGVKALSEIEDTTKAGHGLYTVDGSSDGLEKIVVGALPAGFFSAWTKSIGMPVTEFAKNKPRRFEEVMAAPVHSWLTIEDLFASIPELSDLFVNIFAAKPRWVMPVHDQVANQGPSQFGRRTLASRSYIRLVDETARLTKEDIALFPGPISEISEVSSGGGGRHFRVAVDHPQGGVWRDSLPIHHSPFQRDALLLPIFGVVGEYRAISVVLLYALSIIVRYRPSIWRRVQEGDLDHMRVIIEAFLAVVERILPEQFLATVTGRRIVAKHSGSFF
jgi:YaaC-like protein